MIVSKRIIQILVLLTLLGVAEKLPVLAQTLDIYGGVQALSCSNPSMVSATPHFVVSKIDNRWVFCDALGHPFFDQSLTTNNDAGTDSWNRVANKQSLGVATAATYRPGIEKDSSVNPNRGGLCFTFPTPLPNNVSVMNGLSTSGFIPANYNISGTAIITSVNQTTGEVCVGGLSGVPGGSWASLPVTYGRGIAKVNTGKNNQQEADCSRNSLGMIIAANFGVDSAGLFTVTYTFNGPLPASAIPGNFLLTTGITPTSYNFDNKNQSEQEIIAVSGNTITIGILGNPGSVNSLVGSIGYIDINGQRRLYEKYGDVTSYWGWQQEKRMQSWGFNAIGQLASGWTGPAMDGRNSSWPTSTNPIQMPQTQTMHPAVYGMSNLEGYLVEPIKDMLYTLNSNYKGWRGSTAIDAFDFKFVIEANQQLANTIALLQNSPWLLAVFEDDSDWVWGAGAGPDFVGNHTSDTAGWIITLTPPVETYQGGVGCAYCNKPKVFNQPQMFSKMLVENITGNINCSPLNPCSMRDFLRDRYTQHGTLTDVEGISALNTSWGTSNFYTTFDSTGTCVGYMAGNGPDSICHGQSSFILAETICASSCTATSYSYTLSNNAGKAIDPWSVTIYVGGVAQIGDLPWFKVAGGVKNKGYLRSAASGYVGATSTIDYSTGVVTVNFANAPNASVTVAYIYGGWMAGGTGLMDEDGSHSAWTGTNGKCLEGNIYNTNYFSCVGAGGGYNPLPNANPNFGKDMDDWVADYFAKFAKTYHDALRSHGVQIPFFGSDTVGGWGAPPLKQVFDGYGPYVDGYFGGMSWTRPTPTDSIYTADTPNPEMVDAYQFWTRYGGDKPFISFTVGWGSEDSGQSCSPDNMLPAFSIANGGQAKKGQVFFNQMNYFLNTLSYNNTYQMVGSNWWVERDFQNQNQGLTSVLDNAYDGIEATTGEAVCDPSYPSMHSCGGDTGNYGNIISRIKAANSLWKKALLSSVCQ